MEPERHGTAPPPPPPPPAPALVEDLPSRRADQPEAREEEPRRKHRSFWRELPVLIVIAFAVALIIKTFLLQAFFIPSASMEPTLREGDRVLVEKVSYRFHEPRRGDVVVFEKDLGPQQLPPPEDEPFWHDITDAIRGLFGFPTGTVQDFIKRVVAIEGDRVEGRDGKVYVNDEPVEEPYLAGGTEIAPFGPTVVPDDQIFVMGDNRNNSDDSRSFGTVNVDKVVGRAFVLIWPPADFATL